MVDLAATRLPILFKGLALFTPGGDLFYSIDPSKRHHWHYQLCNSMQEWLQLPEVPLFLSPCYTATVDYWFDRATQSIRVLAEAYPLVWQYRPILNAIFGLSQPAWQLVCRPEGQCDPPILYAYRQQFPQLWESHNLVVQVQPPGGYSGPLPVQVAEGRDDPASAQGYSLRLFVAGHNPTTERILQGLHARMAKLLTQPYTLKVIDVLKQPEQAERDQVLATPTLVKAWPHPVRRLVGDLNNSEKLARLLMSDADSIRHEH